MKLEQAARQALEALEWWDKDGAYRPFVFKRREAITALREALAEPQITTPDVCGEVCARAKLCYGCNKDLEEANAKYAEQAEQEPVLWGDDKFAPHERPQKPEECANGCPPLQVCDYCQTAEQAEPVSPYKALSEDIWSKPFNSGAISEPVQPVSQEPTVSDGLCGGCAKKAADGWALYCVECWEQSEQEPVAWMNEERNTITWNELYPNMTPLYAAPVRTKDLTDDELREIMKQPFNQREYLEQFARAVIAADREKNCG